MPRRSSLRPQPTARPHGDRAAANVRIGKLGRDLRQSPEDLHPPMFSSREASRARPSSRRAGQECRADDRRRTTPPGTTGPSASSTPSSAWLRIIGHRARRSRVADAKPRNRLKELAQACRRCERTRLGVIEVKSGARRARRRRSRHRAQPCVSLRIALLVARPHMLEHTDRVGRDRRRRAIGMRIVSRSPF